MRSGPKEHERRARSDEVRSRTCSVDCRWHVLDYDRINIKYDTGTTHVFSAFTFFFCAAYLSVVARVVVQLEIPSVAKRSRVVVAVRVGRTVLGCAGS